MIIDAHAHLIRSFSGNCGLGEVYDLGEGFIGRLDGSRSLIIPKELCTNGGFLAETLIQQMDAAGIEKAVLMQAYYYGTNNAYEFEAVQKYPDRFVGVGCFDPYAVEREQILDTLLERYGFRVLKFEISQGAGLTGFHPDYRINGDLMEPIYERAEHKDAIIVFDVGKRGTIGYQLEELTKAAKAHPKVTFVICHLLAPDFDTDESQWKKDIGGLAACPNIHFDISALPWNLREPYPFPSGARYARMAADIVGSNRLIWGSDVPCVLQLSSYKEQYDYLSVSGKFSADEIQMILGENAKRLFFK